MSNSIVCSKESVLDSKILLARDWSSIMEWSVDTIPKITQDWTDFSVTDSGILWVNAMSYLYDQTHYTLDEKYLNNISRYSKSIRNLIDMCNLMGIEVPGLVSSITELDISLNSAENVDLPKGTRFEVYDSVSGSSIYLNSIKSVTLARGSNKVLCIEGSPVSQYLSLEDFDSKNRYYFEDTQLSLNSLEVSYLRDEWEKDSDAFLSTKEVPSYSVHRSSDGRTLLKISPKARETVTEGNFMLVTYTQSAGFNGNISKSSEVQFVDSSIRDKAGKLAQSLITITVTSSSGGTDSLEIEDVRKLLGQKSNATETLVNETDYKNIPQYVDHLYHVVARPDSSGVMQVYYEPESDYPNVEELESYLLEYIEKRVPLFMEFEVDRIKTHPFSLKIQVYLNRNEINTEGIEFEIRSYLKKEYSRKNQSPGSSLVRSQLSSRLETISRAISHIIIPEPILDIDSDWNELFDLTFVNIEFYKA
ncbi:baseplate J family protein [Listeria phage LIS04]|nr:baseplate J family protein [Listeria phage LIS04]